MISRLESAYPELFNQLSAASVEVLREAVIVACDYALVRSGLHDDAVSNALVAIRSGRMLSGPQSHDLEKLARRLDGQYLTLHEAEARASSEQLRLFRSARAAFAVVFAFQPDAFKAATEAIYEALNASEDPRELERLINKTIQ